MALLSPPQPLKQQGTGEAEVNSALLLPGYRSQAASTASNSVSRSAYTSDIFCMIGPLNALYNYDLTHMHSYRVLLKCLMA